MMLDSADNAISNIQNSLGRRNTLLSLQHCLRPPTVESDVVDAAPTGAYLVRYLPAYLAVLFAALSSQSQKLDFLRRRDID